MSAKGMIRKTTAIILAITMFWTTIMIGNVKSTQVQAILLEENGEMQKQVLGVKKMCTLLNTKRLGWEILNWSQEVTKIKDIEIGMDEISRREKDFENKVVPATEKLVWRMRMIVYTGISIKDTANHNTNTIIESKHIRALYKFLQMFAGCEVNYLDIYNKKVTQDREELQKIRDTLQANPWTVAPIVVKGLGFYSTVEANTTHPALLQLVIQATKFSREEMKNLNISIAANHIQQAIQLLNGLRCKTLKHLYLRIEKEEQPPYGEAEKESSLTQSEQEWKYDVENLAVLSNYNNCSIILPTWLIRKPTQKLELDMQLYMHLSKEGVESIWAQELEVRIRNETVQSNLESDIIRRKSEGITNEMVTELRLNYYEYTPKRVLTKEETLKCARYCLIWAATQFFCLTVIRMQGLNYLCKDKPGFFRAIDRMDVVFNPRMQSLQHVYLGVCPVKLLENADPQLITMPFVIRPKLWRVFASGEMEEQINKQLGLKEGHEGYIRMQVSESEKNTEKFSCPICHEEFGKDDESTWIYMTWPCRHAFCLACLNNYLKERAPACTLDRISLPGDWRACWRIEEAESNEYSMALSSVKEDNNGKVQIGEFEEVNLIVKY